ncbi:transmembrane protein 199 [Parasteatoda tepidariorum]|uniref:transmembrane protein 199 n=1 Tax=Parasteatoda tepidariorum TaxID=114398 RepID=UPI00077F8FAA|nr:transmembrane protein 199 [Parasteatoda tepidariorum]
MVLMDLLILPPENDQDIFSKESEKSDSKLKDNSISVSNFISLAQRGHFKDAPVHEILEKCDLQFYLPPPPPRSPELEERITRLKAEQSNAEYNSMVRNLSKPQRNNVSFRDDIRSVTSQIAAIVNFMFAVVGSFFFAYKAVEYALPEPNIPAQVMMGIITSTVVALADLYFLLRTTI